MKKAIVTLIVFIPFFTFVFTYYWIKETKIKNSQDYVIMGKTCSCIISCEFIYGIKDGKNSELNIRKEEDKSNIYEVVKKDKNNTQIYEDFKYIANNYKEKDLNTFNNIVALVNEKYHYPLIYQFIITDKGYYIHADLDLEGDKDEYGSYTTKQGIYKYDEGNNSLTFLIELNTCDEVDYFHEK